MTDTYPPVASPELVDIAEKLDEIITLLKAQRTPYVVPSYPVPLWRPIPAYPYQGPYWSVIPPYNPATLMQSGTVQGGPPTTSYNITNNTNGTASADSSTPRETP